MKDLEMYSAEELAEELFRRCDNGVIALDGLPCEEATEDEYMAYRKASGNLTSCLGICVEMQENILRNIGYERPPSQMWEG